MNRLAGHLAPQPTARRGRRPRSRERGDDHGRHGSVQARQTADRVAQCPGYSLLRHPRPEGSSWPDSGGAPGGASRPGRNRRRGVCVLCRLAMGRHVPRPGKGLEEIGRHAHEEPSLEDDALATDDSPFGALPHISIPFRISRLGDASMLFEALTAFDPDLLDQLTGPQPRRRSKIVRQRTSRRLKRVLRLDHGLYEFKDAEIRRVSIRVPACGPGCCPSRVDMEVSALGSGLYQATLHLLHPCHHALRETRPREADTPHELGPGDVWIDETGRRFGLPIPVVIAVPRNSDEDPALVCIGTRARPFGGARADDG